MPLAPVGREAREGIYSEMSKHRVFLFRSWIPVKSLDNNLLRRPSDCMPPCLGDRAEGSEIGKSLKFWSPACSRSLCTQR